MAQTRGRMTQWTHEEYDSLSWHDNHVHALRLAEGEDGAGELELDIDHILAWVPEGGSFRYRIAPARLRFFEVTGLRIDVDWARSSAAMGPFSIDGIERRVEQRTHYKAVCWRIPVNFPPGEITFEATGFEQHLTGSELLADHQCLTRSERERALKD
jgi:hypothetical protein